MSLFGWTVALAYPVGNWILWHLVERERVLLPDEAYGEPEPRSRSSASRCSGDGSPPEVGGRSVERGCGVRHGAG